MEIGERPVWPRFFLRKNAKEPGTRWVGNAADRYNWSAGQPRAAVPLSLQTPQDQKPGDPAGALHGHERNSCPSRSLRREQQCRGWSPLEFNMLNAAFEGPLFHRSTRPLKGRSSTVGGSV